VTTAGELLPGCILPMSEGIALSLVSPCLLPLCNGAVLPSGSALRRKASDQAETARRTRERGRSKSPLSDSVEADTAESQAAPNFRKCSSASKQSGWRVGPS
jgi:hypothetical protein